MNERLLLLFDIDGTLISTKGIAGRLMLKALSEEIRKPIEYDLERFVGSTDRLILQQFIQMNHVQVEELDETIDRVLKQYLSYLATEMNSSDQIKILPGVSELLNHLINDDSMRLGLVTGNVQEAAYVKLKLAGLDAFFPVGAFGSDAIDRNKLPAIAVKRAKNHYKTGFSQKHIWIIGDSPNDILCAKGNGLRCLAVASGWHTINELSAHQPDLVVPSLRNFDPKTFAKIIQREVIGRKQ